MGALAEQPLTHEKLDPLREQTGVGSPQGSPQPPQLVVVPSWVSQPVCPGHFAQPLLHTGAVHIVPLQDEVPLVVVQDLLQPEQWASVPSLVSQPSAAVQSA